MKKLLLLTMLFLSVKSYAQNRPLVVDGNPIIKDTVVVVDSTIKKNILYTKGLEWLATTYVSAKAVIQVQDKEEGLIIGKAIYYATIKLGGLYGTHDYKVDFSIKMQFKDGKAKITFFDFMPDGYGTLKDGKILQYPNVFGKGIIDKSYSAFVKASINCACASISGFTSYINKAIKKEDF